MSKTIDGRRAGSAAGISRSLRTYYGDSERAARMVMLYRQFVAPSGLAFDIGAHVGDRTMAFRWIGARVVAVEPQAAAMRALRLIHGRDAQVTLVAAAVGAQPGEAAMHVNSANPTVSTLSSEFVRAADGAAGWEDEVWDVDTTVPVVTLDGLIAEHGTPDFVKIDVEGLEEAVIAGTSQQIPSLSFEVTMIRRDTGLAALHRLAALGPYRFALSLGESFDLDAVVWQDAEQMAAQIAQLPDAANSGDVYAALPGVGRVVPDRAAG